MMRLLLLCGTLFGLVGCSTALEIAKPAPQAELEALLTRINNAIDPEHKGVNIKSLLLLEEMTLPAQKITIISRTVYKAPNRFRSDIQVAGMPPTTILFNGTEGWTVSPAGGVVPMRGRELEFAALQARIAAPGKKLEDFFVKVVLNSEKIILNDHSYYQLAGYFPESLKLAPSELLVDEKTGLIYEWKMQVPSGLGDVENTIRFLAYRPYDGILFPSRSLSSVMGMELTATLKECRFNVSVADSEFELPADDAKPKQ